MSKTIPENDKALQKEIEHTKHGREFYDDIDTHPKHHEDHSDQQHTVHGNAAGDNPPHAQHDGPDER